ncbi:MAG: MFS transporter [Dehalococcoidia bacterium]|nr:MFS transporter [Dehalococcoidia bacterium]
MRLPHPHYYGYVILAICFTTIVAGYICRNTFSVFYPAIVDEFGWTRGNTALIYSINVLVYGLVAPIAGGLADRFRPRYVLATGAVVTGIGVALCSLASQLWQFYLLYGVLAAIGLSVAGWVPVATLLTNWFVRRRALVFGVLGAGFGLSLIAAHLTQYVILSLGWRDAYLIIGLCVAIIIPPTCIHFIRRTPAEKGLFTDGISAAEAETQPAQAADGGVAQKVATHEWTLGEALRSRKFWLLFLIWICTMGIVEQTVISQQVYFYLDAGYSPLIATTFYGVFGISLAAGNIIGSFSDRIGRERFALPAFVLCLALTGLLLLMRDSTTPWVPSLFAVGFGTCFGTLVCVLNATVADIFHGPHYGSIAGVITLGFAIGGCVSPWLSGYLHDLSGSHTLTYAMVMTATLASLVMYQIVAPQKLRRMRHHIRA